MNQLEKARIKINEIDEQMAKCFEERMKAVEEVIAYKLENNIPVFDSSREKQVIEMNSSIHASQSSAKGFKFAI